MRFLALACTAALLATCATATLPDIPTISKAPAGTPAPKATKADVQANLEDAADKVKAAVDALAHVKDPRPPTYDFAFGGSGGLLVWQLGASAGLAEYGVYTSATRFGGISGGSVVTALTATGVGAAAAISRLLQTIIAALPSTKSRGWADEAGLPTPPLSELLISALLQLLPPNAADLANENSRLHLWATQLNTSVPTILPPSPRAQDLFPYTSRLDLAEAAAASSYVPCSAIGAKTSDYFRGGAWVDAGVSTSLNFLCDSFQPSRGQCIPVVAVVVGPGSPDTGYDGCSPPSLNPANTGPPYPAVPLANWTLPTDCQVYNASADFRVVKEDLTPDAICPGCRLPLPYTQCEWLDFLAFKFGKDLPTFIKTVVQVFELGAKEAAAWAEERGYKRVGQ